MAEVETDGKVLSPLGATSASVLTFLKGSVTAEAEASDSSDSRLAVEIRRLSFLLYCPNSGVGL